MKQYTGIPEILPRLAETSCLAASHQHSTKTRQSHKICW